MIRSDGEESPEILTALYFDSLHENAIDYVLRFLSDTRRAENRTRGIKLEEISGLYDVQGELGAFLYGSFTAIRLLDNGNRSHLGYLECEAQAAMGYNPHYLVRYWLPDRVVPSLARLSNPPLLERM